MEKAKYIPKDQKPNALPAAYSETETILKKKILLLLPLLLITGFLIYTWIAFIRGVFIPTWRHFLALVSFAPVIYLFARNRRKALLATGLYLIIGTCNLLTLTPVVVSHSYGVRVGSLVIETPSFQLLSFGLLVLLCILNFNTLVDIYFEFKEVRQPDLKAGIEVDSEGITVTREKIRNRIMWNEITQMNAFKSDFATWDRIEVEIVFDDRALRINVDVHGWNEFVMKSKELFPTIPENWDTEIVQPPFATNYRTIYSRR